MSLTHFAPVAFIPVYDPQAARAFYETTLGLAFEEDDRVALVFRLGPVRGAILRLVRTPTFVPAPYTIFGWDVPSIEEAVDVLAGKGVTFLRYGFFEQDDRAVWTAPSGARVAWFHDPDGNTLSISQSPD